MAVQPTKEKINGANWRASFSVPPEEVEERIAKLLSDFQTRHAERGFRRGRVPMALIRKKYEVSFVQDAVDALLNETFDAYIDEKGVQVAGRPNVSIDKFERPGTLEFSVDFGVIPPVPEIDFSKITIERLKAEAGDREIDEALKNLAESRRSAEPLAAPRKSRKGDMLTIDFTGFIDGEEFEGGKASGHMLELGSGSFIPGFEDKLTGYGIGDDAEVSVTFPKDYGVEKLAGKKALFKVSIKDIREKKVPEINDGFAKELGRESLADLRGYIKELLEGRYAENAKSLARNEVLEALAKTKVDAPDSLVESEVEFMLAGHDHAHDEKTAEKEKKELRPEAERRVRLGLIVADIGKRENVRISPEEVRRGIMAEAMARPAQSQRIIEYYSENPRAEDAVRAGIFEDKTLDLILSRVNSREKKISADELNKRMNKK
ncbi:MAG: trigger factor [Rickettsiales bacterium]|jgi:trigger factor|nr:trigger factor [Rickettsiales bacterium]